MNRWSIVWKSEDNIYFTTNGIGHGNIPPIPRIGEKIKIGSGYHMVIKVLYDYQDADNFIIEVII